MKYKIQALILMALYMSIIFMASAQNSSVSNKVYDGTDLVIEDMGFHEVKLGEEFKFQPRIIGNFHLCRKDFGHDDVIVHPETGEIRWDTSQLTFGRGFYIRIKCSNYTNFDYGSMIIHVDKSGTSKIRILGKDGIDGRIGIAGQSMISGDTLVVPNGVYPVSTRSNGSYDNAFKMTSPTDGTKNQFSTLIAQTPGGVLITGEATSKFGKQKNAFQLSESNYVAIVGFVVKDVQRGSFTTVGPGNRLLVEFLGAQGAGTWGFPCSNFEEAKKGQCSNAGIRVNRGTPLIQSSYDWGHNRYGIMTRNTKASITRRSLVRLDEHKGDQPYGGFSDYCDSKHISQDNIVFDSLAVAAPHYKNYAGLAAFPATGCAKMKSDLKVVGLLSVNNKLSLSLMDSKAGSDNLWKNIVSYDTEGTCTPQKDRCGAWLLQSKKNTKVYGSFFGKARGFKGSENIRGAFSKKNIQLDDSVIIHDIPGMENKGVPPEYLPSIQLYYNGRSDTFWGDKGYSEQTKTRRWPIPAEDIIASNMRSYRNSKALKVGGGTIDIDGNRGAVTEGNSMSEYFWGYINPNIPPLVVRVNKKSGGNRIAWENFTGLTKEKVLGWIVNCVDFKKNSMTKLKQLEKNTLYYLDNSECHSYAVQAIYQNGVSGVSYIEE